MPLCEPISEDRAEFRTSLTAAEIAILVSDEKVTTLQTNDVVEAHTWGLLNSNLFRYRPDITLRVYWYFGKPCDFSFLQHLPHLRRFSADSLMKTTGMEYISALTNLEHLSIGSYDLEGFPFLTDLKPDFLTHLSLHTTSSKKPRLRGIERFTHLESLYIVGQKNDIELVGQLTHLQDLTLRSVTLPSLGFLRDLPALSSLKIKRGGTKNLADLAYLTRLKYLELWNIKGLSDLSPISEMTGLEFLFLQSLRNVVQLPDLSRLSKLRKVYLETMKGLKDLTPLESAPALEQLSHVAAHGLQPSQYAGLIGRGRLKRIAVGFGSMRKNDALRKMAIDAGVATSWSGSKEVKVFMERLALRIQNELRAAKGG